LEKLKFRSETAIKALKTLEEIVGEPYSTIVRDASSELPLLEFFA
jgi:hypothetical protein